MFTGILAVFQRVKIHKQNQEMHDFSLHMPNMQGGAVQVIEGN